MDKYLGLSRDRTLTVAYIIFPHWLVQTLINSTFATRTRAHTEPAPRIRTNKLEQSPVQEIIIPAKAYPRASSSPPSQHHDITFRTPTPPPRKSIPHLRSRLRALGPRNRLLRRPHRIIPHCPWPQHESDPVAGSDHGTQMGGNGGIKEGSSCVISVGWPPLSPPGDRIG